MADRAKRLKITAACLATSKCTKAALTNILQTLHDEGVLDNGLGVGTTHTIRKEIRQAQEQHGFSDTPYGKVVQSMDLPFNALRKWDYCHPWALLYHLSRICESFSDLMWTLRDKSTLNIILYIDEVVPGNVLRHDKGRTLQAIYWAVVDWPECVLSRHESWPMFAVVQSELCSQIDGGILTLLPLVMKVFWPDGDVSVKTVLHRDVPFALPYRFVGWIGDLDAHSKAISSSKTIGATKPCITCENVIKWLDLDARPNDTTLLRDISCCEPSEFIMNSDQCLFQKADRLQAAHRRRDANTDALATELGINYVPTSMLFDPSMRGLYKPVTHTIRDWMHMLVSEGVAGTELCLCIKECLRHVSIDVIHTYTHQFRLPKVRGGSVPKEFFTMKSLGDHTMKHFASEQLTMIPLFNAFLQDIMRSLKVMPHHIQSFALLEELVALLSLGADKSMAHINRIEQLIYHHGIFYKALYGESQCRPKFHHLYHIPDNMRTVTKLISCFVLERKHRATKDAARESFRHIEHTVVIDMVNRQCTNAQSKSSSFKSDFLVEPQSTSIAGTFSAASAVTRIGTVCVSDLLFLSDGSVVKVLRLWHDNRSVVAQVAVCSRVKGSLWQLPVGVGSRFVDVVDIVATLTYAIESSDVVRIIVPVLHR